LLGPGIEGKSFIFHQFIEMKKVFLF